jgi:hypothetical protein
MWGFKKSKQTDQPIPERYVQVSNRCNDVGHRISDYLQNQTNRLSPIRLKVACLLFVLLAGGGNVWIMVGSLRHPSPVIQVTPISRPIDSIGKKKTIYHRLK